MSLKPIPPESFPEENLSRDPRKPRNDSSRIRQTFQMLESMSRTPLGGDDLKGRIHSPSLLEEMGDSVHMTFSHTRDVLKSQGMPSTVAGAIVVAGCGGIELLTFAPKAAGSFFITPVVKRACKLTAITEKGCRAAAQGVQKAASWIHEQSEGIEKEHGVSASFFTQCVMNIPLLSVVPRPPQWTIVGVVKPNLRRKVHTLEGSKVRIESTQKLLPLQEKALVLYEKPLNTHPLLSILRTLPREISPYFFDDLAATIPPSYVCFTKESSMTEVFRKGGTPEMLFSQIYHLDFLSRSLRNGHTPQVLGLDARSPGDWYMHLSKEPGQNLLSWIKESSEDSIEGIYQLGKVLGEMETIARRPFVEKELHFYTKDLLETYLHVAETLEGRLRLPHTSEEIKSLNNQFLSNPAYMALAHDDPQLQNFIWDQETHRLTVIDIGAVIVGDTRSLSQAPVGFSLYNILEELDAETHQFDSAGSTLLRKAALKGYQETNPLSPAYYRFIHTLKLYQTLSAFLHEAPSGPVASTEALRLFKLFTSSVEEMSL